MRRIILACTLLVCAAAVAQDEEPETLTVRVQIRCEGDHLTGIRLFVPAPGVVTVPIPPGVCAETPSSGPPAPARPGLTI